MLTLVIVKQESKMLLAEEDFYSSASSTTPFIAVIIPRGRNVLSVISITLLFYLEPYLCADLQSARTTLNCTEPEVYTSRSASKADEAKFLRRLDSINYPNVHSPNILLYELRLRSYFRVRVSHLHLFY